MSLVSRDPFAREEIHRELVQVSGKVVCSWCGNKRHHGGKKTTTLYRYRLESDGGSVRQFDGLFCSAGCFKSYYF